MLNRWGWHWCILAVWARGNPGCKISASESLVGAVDAIGVWVGFGLVLQLRGVDLWPFFCRLVVLFVASLSSLLAVLRGRLWVSTDVINTFAFFLF
ncbi:hypothetical protein SUGI_0556530 [Cryptomeria japonica]|nr:hypothetical protein SUGI_0556530 [Cryptomeria japonica]